ncbi:natriuretic peptides A [Lampris incognitus]|uniref:natriuretic peptides A n=1 Tax=Lampris incognitus TaxID=2546036 RepID=UPI0024B5B568|nr:natriuretic peptides A [Lampris incognitus]
MRMAVLWGLLTLLCQHTLVSCHVLGRPYSSGDLAQLKSVLERFEESLAEAAQEETPEADYEGTNTEPERGQASRGWSPDQGEGQRLSLPERPQPPAEGRSWTPSQRSRLQDLLMSVRGRVSGCFGGRMDRIGNTSGLGCNGGRALLKATNKLLGNPFSGSP